MVKRVLVSGGAGFLGSHLCDRLIEQGHKVICLDNLFTSEKSNIQHLMSHPHFEFVRHDVIDPYKAEVDWIFNLACPAAPGHYQYNPIKTIKTSVMGAINMLGLCKRLGGRIMHASTSEVYGSAKFVPITEEHPLQGQSPYAASKIAADQLVYSFHASFDLPTVTIRPFNTFGPRQSQRAVIPSIITQILSGAEEIELGALTPTRDFSFVDDTVQGFVKALSADGIFGQTINLGSGFEVSIGQTFDLISKILGQTVIINKSKERLRPETSEVDRLMSENARAKMALNWKPKYASLIGFEDGLRVVRRRGELMQEACESSSGGMAAIVGLDEEAVRGVCEQAGVSLANLNCPGQIVLSGDADKMEAACEAAKAAGAKRAIPLPVAGAYHSPLMQPAQAGLAEALAKVELREPSVPVYSNVTGQAHAGAASIAGTMVDQVTSSVRWEACIRAMIADGVTRFIELGPGTALTGFMRRIDRGLEVLNVADNDSLAKSAEALNA